MNSPEEAGQARLMYAVDLDDVPLFTGNLMPCRNGTRTSEPELVSGFQRSSRPRVRERASELWHKTAPENKVGRRAGKRQARALLPVYRMETKLNMKVEKRALDEVKSANPGSTRHAIANIYPNFLGGTLVAVNFEMPDGVGATNHVHIVGESFVVYRLFHDVCNAVSGYRERRWFFRLLEFAGMGGVIALFLILVFSILLSIIALWGVKADQTVVEIVKLSFTTVLGYFFGSQATKR